MAPTKDHIVYPFSQLVKDVEPHSLYPREEIKKLLEVAFMIILINVKAGRKVVIPHFGSFRNQLIKRGGYSYHPVTHEKHVCRPRYIMRCEASPFTEWLLAPHTKRNLDPYRVSLSVKIFNKFRQMFMVNDPKYADFNIPNLMEHHGLAGEELKFKDLIKDKKAKTGGLPLVAPTARSVEE
jgi:nucleoid DNA-binding protein